MDDHSRGTRLNKPRVFLSLSEADAPFIERLKSDLRVCQIDTWLYTEDIPHGKPWLEAIFEAGIPTCDAVLVYFTETSVESEVVKKEVDATMMQQLKDKRIAFLPYVSASAIREKLRLDIQALQTPIWNEDNYCSLLPRVVAEIWRSYLERTLILAVQEEKVKRLEAERQVERYQRELQASVFSPAEEAEFSYIWKVFDRYEPVVVLDYTPQMDAAGGPRTGFRQFEMMVQLQTLVTCLIMQVYEYSYMNVQDFLREPVKEKLKENDVNLDSRAGFNISAAPYPEEELVMFGLLERSLKQGPVTTYCLVWSAKSIRLRYWLAFNNRLPNSVSFRSEINTLADL